MEADHTNLERAIRNFAQEINIASRKRTRKLRTRTNSIQLDDETKREKELSVSTSDIVDHAVSLDPNFKDGRESFLCSWVYKFMKRYNLTTRWCTRKSQITDAVMEQVRKDFCNRVMHALHN